jgi:alkanesulfonate monooxygenase SsuD/methylene tetrahydromethanopterin reductase-like flavin-dependent oxidoreductase (luciferase family)
MRIGVVFPQTELGGDPGAVRAFATTASELGFAHIAVFDHVVGADPAVHRGWSGPYDVHTTFHEPFVLFGYLAALTSLELVTSVVILPQRQTVLQRPIPVWIGAGADVALRRAGRIADGWFPMDQPGPALARSPRSCTAPRSPPRAKPCSADTRRQRIDADPSAVRSASARISSVRKVFAGSMVKRSQFALRVRFQYFTRSEVIDPFSRPESDRSETMS